MGWKVLSGNDIHSKAYYVMSNIPIFLKNAEFVCSVEKKQLPFTEKRLDNIK